MTSDLFSNWLFQCLRADFLNSRYFDWAFPLRSEDVTQSAWAWFEAMDRTAMAQHFILLSLGEQVAILKTPRAQHLVKAIIASLATLHELCADKMNECEY